MTQGRTGSDSCEARTGRGTVSVGVMMFLYSVGLSLLLLASSPVWLWRMLRQGRYRQGLRGRLGEVPQRLRACVADKPVVWIHCVSVGETLAATRLIADLETALPGHVIVVSTTTPTGQRVARERFGVDRVFFFPLDFAFAVRPYLQALQPKLLILMESELWPRVLVECECAGVPVAVVNARVSDRSFPRYLRLRALWKPLLSKLSLLLAQSDEDARRWKTIGAPDAIVHSTGNLKFDVRSAGETPLTQLVREHLPQDAPVLVCGSTHEGEESLLLDCWRSLTMARVMILAPRHPERAVEVEQLCRQRTLQSIRLSAWRVAASPIAVDSVLIVDTVGELASIYGLATVAFVGGSLVQHGGQNPLEPARLGVPVVMGESFQNFREMVAAMRAADAIQIVTPEDLCSVLQRFLATGNDNGHGERGRVFASSMLGATQRTVTALLTLLQERAQ